MCFKSKSNIEEFPCASKDRLYDEIDRLYLAGERQSICFFTGIDEDDEEWPAWIITNSPSRRGTYIV